MLPRITAQNALPALEQLTDELERLVRNVGHLGSAVDPILDLQKLQSDAKRRILPVDIALADGKCLSRDSILKLLLPSLEQSDLSGGEGLIEMRFGRRYSDSLRVQFWSGSTAPVLLSNSLFAPILICDENVLVDPNSLQLVKSAAEDRPIVIVFSNELNKYTQLLTEGWVTEAFTLVSATRSPILARLEQAGSTILFDILLACSLANSLRIFTIGIGLMMDAEALRLKARKATALQKLARFQQRVIPAGPVEFSTTVRHSLQRQFTEFSRNCAERSQRLLLLQIGSIWETMERSLQLIQIEQEKRSRTIVLRIPHNLEEALLREVRQILESHFKQDLVAMHDLLRLSQREIEAKYESETKVPITLPFLFIPPDRIDRFLNAQVIMHRKYQGEMHQQGFYDLYMIARRPLFVLMSIVGLASAVLGFGFFQQQSSILKYAAPVLLLVGIFIALRSAKQEREDLLANELDRAREILRSEFKRIFSELFRSWPASIEQHLNEEMTRVVQKCESAMKDQITRRATEINDEKNKIQQQLQSIETADRRLQNSVRPREALTTTISQIRGELRQLLVSYLRSTERVQL